MENAVINLRRTLWGNAIFSGLSGLLFCLFHPSISAWMPIAENKIILALGIGLLLFSGSIIFVLRQRELPGKQVMGIIIQDGLWVLGSIVIILFQFFQLNPEAYVAIALIAVTVGVLGALQYWFLRSSGR